jgi:hypothetical protein
MFFYWRKYSTVICNILLKITTICGKICDSFMVKCVYGVDNQIFKIKYIVIKVLETNEIR